MDKSRFVMPANIQQELDSSLSGGSEKGENSSGQTSYFKNAGELLRETLDIFKNRFGTFLEIILIILVVNFIFYFLFGKYFFYLQKYLNSKIDISEFKAYGLGISSIIIYGLVNYILEIIGTVSLLTSIHKGNENLLKILVQGLLKIIPFLVISGLFAAAILIGSIFLIIPGIIFAVWYSLSIYVFVSEDLRGFKALNKSKELIRNFWWQAFWRLIVIFILTYIFNLIVNFISKEASSLFSNASYKIIISYLKKAIEMIWLGFSLIYGYLIYKNLREIKGGVDYKENA